MMDKKSPNKILKERVLFNKQKGTRITWADIKNFKFEDNDLIEIAYDEGHVSENNSWEPHWYVQIIRLTEESDHEFKKRLEQNARDAEWARERRYESYLKLKAEFEDEEGGTA